METSIIQNQKVRFFLVFILILLAFLTRLLPHVANATPLIAISLFAGVYLGWKESIIVPTIAMALSDLFIGFYALPIILSVYGSFITLGLISYFARKHINVVTSVSVALTGSALFFLVTNAAVWLFGTMYPHTLSGLLLSYEMGLPFFKAMVVGDVLYTFALFGVYEYVIVKKLSFKTLRVNRAM